MLSTSVVANAQVEFVNGPNLENDRDSKMNRLLGGDDNSFYCYRIRSKGRGTSYFVEKYDKATLKPLFSKEIEAEEDRLTKIEDVEYAASKVYIFVRNYNKESNKMTLYYQSVSASGLASKDKEEIVIVNSDHYEFVDFDIYPNPGKTKFLIKVSHKENKEDSYKTDFILIDATSMKKIWSKRIDSKLKSSGTSFTYSFWGGLGYGDDVGFIGISLDDDDNIYFASSYYAKNSTDKIKRYKANVSIIEAKSQEPKITELKFDDDYLVKDVQFSKTPNNELVVGGFLKDVIERKGRDLVKVGVFSFTINISTGAIVSNTVKMFDDKILTALESSAKQSRYFRYKLDYIFPIGKDVYYVGEQYREEQVTTYNSQSHSSSTYWEYEYMDVIIAKLNSKGTFEWIKNTPLRNNMRLNYPHVFKQYIAIPTENNLYILNNEHEKNIKIYAEPDFEPKDLKSMSGIHGSNFTYTSVSLSNGSLTHKLIFNNEDYCFAPIQERNIQFIPPSDTEIFVKGKNNEIYIYTEDRGRDRFGKITFAK